MFSLIPINLFSWTADWEESIIIFRPNCFTNKPDMPGRVKDRNLLTSNSYHLISNTILINMLNQKL